MQIRRMRFTYTVEQFDVATDALLVTYIPADPNLPVVSSYVRLKESDAEMREAILAAAPTEQWEREVRKRERDGTPAGAKYEGLTGEGRVVEVEQARAKLGAPMQAAIDLDAAKQRRANLVEIVASTALVDGIDWTFDDGQVGRVKVTTRTMTVLSAISQGKKNYRFRVADGRKLPITPGQAKSLLAKVMEREDEVRQAQWAVVDRVDASESLADLDALTPEREFSSTLQTKEVD